MRICLIQPNANFIKEKSSVLEFKKIIDGKYVMFDGMGTALATIAGLTPSKHEIEIIDENFREIDYSKNYDLVGISVLTNTANRSYAIADKFKQEGIKVILGGVHPTVLPEEAIQHASAVVIGEAENVWGNLLRDHENNSLKTYYKSDKFCNLTTAHKPKFNLFDYSNYHLVWLQTSRGCPHDCDFCTTKIINGTKYRRKTNIQILGEIKSFINHYPNKELGFGDDNFFMDNKSTKELLKMILPLNLRWHCMSDISIADHDDILTLAKDSGCISILIGLESISKKNLMKINQNNYKYNKHETYSKSIHKIQLYGIGVHGTFIFGLDHDTQQTFKDTSDFILNNNLYASTFTILTPFPGTRVRERLKKENRVLSTEWNNYTKFSVNIIPKNITQQGLIKGITELYQITNSKEYLIRRLKYFKQIYDNLE